MNLKQFTNIQLHQQTQCVADKERLTTIELLWHLHENEKRMLYAQMGYRDLKEYCVKELKLSEYIVILPRHEINKSLNSFGV